MSDEKKPKKPRAETIRGPGVVVGGEESGRVVDVRDVVGPKVGDPFPNLCACCGNRKHEVCAVCGN